MFASAMAENQASQDVSKDQIMVDTAKMIHLGLFAYTNSDLTHSVTLGKTPTMSGGGLFNWKRKAKTPIEDASAAVAVAVTAPDPAWATWNTFSGTGKPDIYIHRDRKELKVPCRSRDGVSTIGFLTVPYNFTTVPAANAAKPTNSAAAAKRTDSINTVYMQYAAARRGSVSDGVRGSLATTQALIAADFKESPAKTGSFLSVFNLGNPAPRGMPANRKPQWKTLSVVQKRVMIAIILHYNLTRPRTTAGNAAASMSAVMDRVWDGISAIRGPA
jgi:hypothetical protein